MFQMRPCTCCDTVPPAQEGDVREFHSNRDVLGLAREWRRENQRRPFSEAMCLAHDVTKPGGLLCRTGEEVCHGRTTPCLIHTITAPFYFCGIPFLINNLKIKKKIEKLIEEDKKVDKNKKKTNPEQVAKRAAFQAYLDQTFDVMKEDIRELIMCCPVR